jgi:hypothetical protein
LTLMRLASSLYGATLARNLPILPNPSRHGHIENAQLISDKTGARRRNSISWEYKLTAYSGSTTQPRTCESVWISLPVVGGLGAGRAPVQPHGVRGEPSVAVLSARARSLPMNYWPIADVGEREERTAAATARWLA